MSIKGGPFNNHGKISILIQSYISRGSMDYFSLVPYASYTDSRPRLTFASSKMRYLDMSFCKLNLKFCNAGMSEANFMANLTYSSSFLAIKLPIVVHGENISDLESESESESEFLVLGPSLPRTPISVPSLEPELSPSLSLSPSSTPESEPVSVLGPSRPSVLQESTPPAPTLVYQRRSKPDLLQKQIQSPEPEVSTENDSSSDDCAISDTCDTNPVDLPIALRKDKRSCPSLYRHPISQYVSTKHLSTQYQSFIAAVDSVKIPSSVEEALQNRNWVQAMDEEMRALKKMEMI
ncbi:hypothetical protein KIW84_064589 [Lathyrus oleraceus]|uniref:Mitochondrial protein n=1 Tax=Pisum sativum TaxID=3888 RepID=A0A9D5A8Z4_PEA|nr:hypothetical protein KIW84_064589 [Pisum sativum]